MSVDHTTFHLNPLKKQKIPTLKTLNWAQLHFSPSKTEGINDLYRILRNQKSLNSISLSLKFRNKFEIHAHTLIIRKLKRIRTFKLLESSKHIDGLWKKLVSNLKHLKSLTLTLDKNINDKGLEELSNGLKNLSSLSELSLEIPQNFIISNKGLFALSRNLKHLRSLSSFKLTLIYLHVTDEGLKSICKFEAISTSSLHIIHLSITDEGIKSISQSIKSLKLSNLLLDFGSCYEISDKGLESLFLNLQNNSSLLQLELDFSSNTKITNNSFHSLSKCLENNCNF